MPGRELRGKPHPDNKLNTKICYLKNLKQHMRLPQGRQIWIWLDLTESGHTSRHTVGRWPAPGTHAGSYLRTVQLAKAMDKVLEACMPSISTLIWSHGLSPPPAN